MNRYCITIIILLCIVPALSSAQVYWYMYESSDFGFRSESKHYAFNISDGYYELNNTYGWSGGGCGQMYTEAISYGFALRSADTILLHDVRGGYNIRVIVTDTTLKVLDGFEGLKKMVFTGGGKANHTGFMVRLFMKNPDEYLSRKTSLDSMLFSGGVEDNKPTHKFSEGLYVGGLPEHYKGWPLVNPDSVGLHVAFTKQEYQYKDGSILLTKGEWRRKGRYILLNDHTLNAYFILRLIGDNKFTTEVFPFANYDLELMKVE